MNNINFNATVSEIQCEANYPNIRIPCRCGIFGPSESGKSTFIYKLIKFQNLVFSDTFDRIIYCMPNNTEDSRREYIAELRSICSNIYIVEGLPNLQDYFIKDNREKKLLILDDLSTQVISSRDYQELMTQGSHHYNVSVVYTSQNYFEKSPKYGKTFHRQLTVKVLFEDVSDISVMKNVSSQMFESASYLQRCLEIKKKSFSGDKNHYLVLGT